MSFNSPVFLLFFAAVYILLVLLYLLFRNKNSFGIVNKIFLLTVSYIFLAYADWRFALCLFGLTVIVYFSAKGMEIRRKPWAVVGIGISLLQLLLFKYLNFFTESFAGILGASFTELHLIIPLGVSFYTFSAIAYLVDVYRGKYKAEQSFLNVALYLSFFPKLVSGPIVRADSFIPQLDDKHHVSRENFTAGIQIMVWGLFKKIVIADHLAVFVANVFAVPRGFTGGTVFLAILAYSVQIYFDFAGYSDMAVGMARMMGFELGRNFNLPYLSKNPTEFWKRWHISLSSWLQEYLYYPLGGNRKGTLRTYLNLFLTMLIGGLWHGADWTFVIWGAVHGAALIVHKLFMRWKEKTFGDKNAGGLPWKILSTVLTFLYVSFTWVFFRASSLSNAMEILKSLFNGNDAIRQPFSWAFVALFAAAAEIALAVFRNKKEGNGLEQKYLILNLSRILPLAFFFFVTGLLVMTGYFGNFAFVYAKF